MGFDDVGTWVRGWHGKPLSSAAGFVLVAAGWLLGVVTTCVARGWNTADVVPQRFLGCSRWAVGC